MVAVVGVAEEDDGAGDVVARQELKAQQQSHGGRAVVGLGAGDLAFLVEDRIDAAGKLDGFDVSQPIES